MKTLYKFRYEGILIFLLCAMIGLFSLLPASGMRAFLFGAGLTLNIALIIFVLLRLYKEKWKKALVVGIQKIFSAIARRFSLWLEQRNIRKKRNILSGETQIQFHFEESEKTPRKQKKIPRWKQLKTEREKMKYLYRKTVNGRVRRGARIYASHTPEEISVLEENSETETELFSLYNQYRYDERSEPPEGASEKIKNQR